MATPREEFPQPIAQPGHPETGQPGRARDWVAEKNDGERVNLLFGRTEDTDEEYCFLVRRNRTMVQVNATAAPEGTYDGTLLDGEWMGDRILVFDAVVVAGYSKRKKPFSARLAAARDFLRSISIQGISVSAKTFVPVREIARLVKDIKAGTKGKCDGLVFMPEKDWVATGRAQNIFKWKPVNLNTIDLRYDGAAWYTSGGFEPYPLSLEGPPPASPGIYELRPLGDNQWAVEAPPRQESAEPRDDGQEHRVHHRRGDHDGRHPSPLWEKVKKKNVVLSVNLL